MAAEHPIFVTGSAPIGPRRVTCLATALVLAMSMLPALAVAGAEAAPNPQRWVPPMDGSTLPAGAQLSSALKRYAALHGWTIDWQLLEDYALDVDLQLPGINVVADSQWVIKGYQKRGVMAGVWVDVNSETKRLAIAQKGVAGPAADRDPVVEMRMSALSVNPLQQTSSPANVSRSPLAPLPRPHAASFAAPVSRLVPLKTQPKDPHNPGLRLVPMSGMPVAPVGDVRAAEALVAAREADRKLAERSAARWSRIVQATTTEQRELEVQSMLPPPDSVTDLPVATAAVTAAPSMPPARSSALSLGSVTQPSDVTSLKVSSLDKGVEAMEPAQKPRPPAPAKPTPAADVWTASNGMSMRSAVESWASRAGWVIKWDARIDYDVIGTLTYTGSFLEAVDKLFDAYRATPRPLRADAYARQNLILVQE